MRSDDDRRVIHARILGVALEISAPLCDAIRTVGPVSLPNREDKGLGHFLSRAIIGQQLSTMAARSIWARVEAAASSAGSDIPQFLDYGSASTLRACGVSGNKIRALHSVHVAERDGVLCSEDLGNLDHERRSERLRSVWGVGQWTCDMASMFYFRCPDVWPEGDMAVKGTFARLIGRRKPAPVVAQFIPYRSYLALAMWKIRDAIPQQST